MSSFHIIFASDFFVTIVFVGEICCVSHRKLAEVWDATITNRYVLCPALWAWC